MHITGLRPGSLSPRWQTDWLIAYCLTQRVRIPSPALVLAGAANLLTAHVPHAERLYGIVAVVVIFSVFVQGRLVPGRRPAPAHTNAHD